MRLSSIKKYRITTSLANYNNHLDDIKKNNIFNIRISNDLVVFDTNECIDIAGFECVNKFDKTIKKIVLPNIFLLIIVITIMLVLYVTPYYIKELKYKTGSIKDDIVYEYLKNKLEDNQRIDLRIVSKQLMIDFPHYSWIDVKKQGRIIYLYIELNQITQLNKLVNNLPGDLISGYDAYIKSLYVNKGKPLIDVNQTVKKGDVLISGNINGNIISSNGIVIGEVVYFKEIEVNKVTTVFTYTGNLINYKYLSIGKQQFKKPKNKFNNFKSKQDIIINVLDWIKLIDETVYEMNISQVQHNQDTAINYAKSLVYYELEKYRSSDQEHIISIDLFQIRENDESYYIKMLVKANKNIVVFRQY